MKITLIVCGKTSKTFLAEGIGMYLQRIRHLVPFEIITLPDVKKPDKMSEEELKKEEGKVILRNLEAKKYLVLMDERGVEMSSVEMARFLEGNMLSGLKELVFLIGGPYGFSREVYQRANKKISLSKMTFSHQLIRLIFLEQLYRALTIVKGLPYHHS